MKTTAFVLKCFCQKRKPSPRTALFVTGGKGNPNPWVAGSSCAYQDINAILEDDDWISFNDNSNKNCHYVDVDDLGIHSVSALKGWLQREYPEFFIKKKLTIEEVHQAIKQSAFAKQGYTVNV